MSNFRIFLKFDVYRKYIDINYACEYIFFNMQIPENPKSIQATCVDLPHVYIGVRPRYISRVGFPQCASSSSATYLHSPIFSPQDFLGWRGFCIFWSSPAFLLCLQVWPRWQTKLLRYCASSFGPGFCHSLDKERAEKDFCTTFSKIFHHILKYFGTIFSKTFAPHSERLLQDILKDFAPYSQIL